MTLKPSGARNMTQEKLSLFKEFNFFISYQDYRNAFEKFRLDSGRYPTATDIDKIPYLPTSRTIQRKFGGLKELRKLIGLSGDDLDQRSGAQRATVVVEMGLRSFNDENMVYKTLINKYGKQAIHRQAPYCDTRLLRTDFKIHTPNKSRLFVDIFYPRNKYSLLGCINGKQNKLKSIKLKDQIIFVVMNKTMTQGFIDNLVLNKKNQLPPNIKVVNYETFINVV